MDFFDYQEAARKKTSLLVFYFALAVLLIVIAVYVVVSVAASDSLWNPYRFLFVSAGVLALIGLSSLYKIHALAAGGQAIAAMLGGRRLHADTRDAGERRLLHVVEEMALASGTPIPPVFLLDREAGINAFAAGFTPGDAVIGVTRGSMELLTRDELQGVIAHEFSHILNGDMRLNIRLMGVLHGILVIALIGYALMRSGHGVRLARRERGGAAYIALVGVALLIVGYTGVFFAKLIKSAVSRQREFLGDAAAVQFTRNPAGLAGTLKKIGGLSSGSRIAHSQAEQASHMFFGNALRSSFLGLLSTHPPLDVRIRRIDPSFDGKYPVVERPAAAKVPERGAPARPDPAAVLAGLAGATAGGATRRLAFQPDRAVEAIGAPRFEHIQYAAALLERIPEPLRNAAHDPFAARAVALALLSDPRPEVRKRQMQELRDHADSIESDEAARMLTAIDRIPVEMRLPLVELTLPSLRELSHEQYRRFRTEVDHLIHADDRVSTFEFALRRMLIHHLDRHFGDSPPAETRYYSIKPVLTDCRVLLSALAHAGHADESAAATAFQTAWRSIGEGAVETPIARADLHMDALDQALQRLEQTIPGIKKRVLHACAAGIGADGAVTIEEAELLRVVADCFDCPMPPLI